MWQCPRAMYTLWATPPLTCGGTWISAAGSSGGSRRQLAEEMMGCEPPAESRMEQRSGSCTYTRARAVGVMAAAAHHRRLRCSPMRELSLW